MNTGLIGLYLLTALIILGVVGGLSWAVLAGKFGTPGSGHNQILPPCDQTTDLSKLVQITDEDARCFQNGLPTYLYYIGTISGGKLDYTVAPFKKAIFDVCVGFCCTYSNGVCEGSDYAGRSAKDNFADCMAQLSSTTCVPPAPMAVKGSIVYYPYSPTCNVCQGCSAKGNPCDKNAPFP